MKPQKPIVGESTVDFEAAIEDAWKKFEQISFDPIVNISWHFQLVPGTAIEARNFVAIMSIATE